MGRMKDLFYKIQNDDQLSELEKEFLDSVLVEHEIGDESEMIESENLDRKV